MIAIHDAFARVHLADTGAGYDFEIPFSDIESVTHNRRINRRKDEGTIVLHNHDGTYSVSDKQLQLGDRIDVFVTPEQAVEGWGDDNTLWGHGGYGGGRFMWSAFIEQPTYIRTSSKISNIVLDCTDYVFALMSNRITFDSFDDRPISGSDDAILETVVGRECPEIDLSDVSDVNRNTTIVADGTNVLEFVIKLARRAEAVLWGYRDRLYFERLEDVGPEWTVDLDEDISPLEHSFDGTTVFNDIRVDGATDHTFDDDTVQTTQDGWRTVTQSDRRTFQVSTRKSQLDRVELWTDPTRTDSEEDLTIRLQKDDGGSPVAIADTESDIDSHKLSHEFLAHDDYTTFLLNEHTLPEPNPWVIVESEGDVGQDIGIDTTTSTPTYRAHYPFPVSVQLRDATSVKDHTRIEEHWKQKNLYSLDAARDLAREGLHHEREPESDISFNALSGRAHRLDPGEFITINAARERVEGDYIVTEIENTFNGNTVTSQITVTDPDTI